MLRVRDVKTYRELELPPRFTDSQRVSASEHTPHPFALSCKQISNMTRWRMDHGIARAHMQREGALVRGSQHLAAIPPPCRAAKLNFHWPVRTGVDCRSKACAPFSFSVLFTSLSAATRGGCSGASRGRVHQSMAWRCHELARARRAWGNWGSQQLALFHITICIWSRLLNA
jgi:hypothetical protein